MQQTVAVEKRYVYEREIIGAAGGKRGMPKCCPGLGFPVKSPKCHPERSEGSPVIFKA